MRAINAAVLVVSCLVSLVLAELAVRLLLPAPQIVTIQKASDIELRHEIENRTRYNLQISGHPEQATDHFFIMTLAGRRIRANTHAVVENHEMNGRRIELQTNSIGYRNREISRKRGDRILFLGDSITLGAYLPEEETFVRRVESLAAAAGRKWETINAGVSGISLKNELAILQETGLALEPDIVVLGFYLNDFQESPGVYIHEMPPLLRRSRLFYFLFRGLYVQLPDTPTPEKFICTKCKGRDKGKVIVGVKDYMRIYRLESERIAQWKEGFRSEREGRSDGDGFYRQVLDSFSDWGGAWSPHMWDYIQPLFAELKLRSEERGFRVVVVGFPALPQVEAEALHDYPQQRLRAVADQLDLPLLDLLPIFRARHHTGAGKLFYDQCHHTPYGNQVIAESIYRFIASHL